MSIQPVGIPGQIPGLTGTGRAADADKASFKDIFENLVDSVRETDAKVRQDEISVATGASDDLHTLMIDMAKADLALYTLVQVRNKALEAYNEIMKMGL